MRILHVVLAPYAFLVSFVVLVHYVVLAPHTPLDSSTWGPPLGALVAGRASPCSPLPTLPEAAAAVLASSPGDGCCFPFIGQNYCSDRSYLFVGYMVSI